VAEVLHRHRIGDVALDPRGHALEGDHVLRLVARMVKDRGDDRIEVGVDRLERVDHAELEHRPLAAAHDDRVEVVLLLEQPQDALPHQVVVLRQNDPDQLPLGGIS